MTATTTAPSAAPEHTRPTVRPPSNRLRAWATRAPSSPP